MSVKDVTMLRRQGRLDEALRLAKRELEEGPDKWTRMSMFWVLRDYAQNVFIPANNMEQAKHCITQMEYLLPNMMDDSGAGEKAYRNLLKQMSPDVDILRKAYELSKTDPDSAYNMVVQKYGLDGSGLDERLHEDYGWILYRYLKANHGGMDASKVCDLLACYVNLENERPSLLHSMMISLALALAKEHESLSFYDFFMLCGIDGLREEDYEDQWFNGKSVPSLVSRICRQIIASGEDVEVMTFVDLFGRHWNEAAEHLRKEYFWKLMNFHKNNEMQDLWKAFDHYAKNYSACGPSYWHSEILKIANRFMVNEDTYRFLYFMKEWDGKGNLRKDDWQNEKGDDGNEYPSLAARSIKKCFGILKDDAHGRKDANVLNWLESLYTRLIEREADNDWYIRNLATICIWKGSIDKAISSYKHLLLDMGEKYYLWEELADCVQDEDIRIGLLLKAKDLESNEDFLGNLHLSLAKSWLGINCHSAALHELELYANHRMKKGWGVSGDYGSLLKQCAACASGMDQEANALHYIQLAEDFVYSEHEWREFVLTDKWEHDGTERCNFYNAESLFFSVKAKRFKALGKASKGDVFSVRCKMPEEAKTNPQKSVEMKTVTPLVLKETDLPRWSTLPTKYGIVDGVNPSKSTLFIITQDSKEVPFPYEGDGIRTNTFVKFVEYKEKRKDETRINLVNLSSCPREEALPNMRHRVVVVDDVNERKQLFHVVLGKNLVSDIVRFDQTDIRPLIGDFLLATYCIKRNKEGKKRIKFLDLQRTAEECNGVKKTVSGRLVMKYRSGECGYWMDLDGHEHKGAPDFAFIDDYYVHRNMLIQYGIDEDCDVTAQLVLGGDNKWRVYELLVHGK